MTYDWLSIPLLVDVILFGMAVEALWLFWRHRHRGLTGVPPLTLHLLSGALLLFAMKLALAAAPASLTASVLGLAGISHFWEMRRALSSHSD